MGSMFTDTVTGDVYPEGYGPTSPEVLRPAFLEAYSGRSNKANRDYLPNLPPSQLADRVYRLVQY